MKQFKNEMFKADSTKLNIDKLIAYDDYFAKTKNPIHRIKILETIISHLQIHLRHLKFTLKMNN